MTDGSGDSEYIRLEQTTSSKCTLLPSQDPHSLSSHISHQLVACTNTCPVIPRRFIPQLLSSTPSCNKSVLPFSIPHIASPLSPHPFFSPPRYQPRTAVQTSRESPDPHVSFALHSWSCAAISPSSPLFHLSSPSCLLSFTTWS